MARGAVVGERTISSHVLHALGAVRTSEERRAHVPRWSGIMLEAIVPAELNIGCVSFFEDIMLCSERIGGTYHAEDPTFS